MLFFSKKKEKNFFLTFFFVLFFSLSDVWVLQEAVVVIVKGWQDVVEEWHCQDWGVEDEDEEQE